MRFATACLLCAAALWPGAASAEVTAAHRKQVEEVRKDLGKEQGLLNKRQFDEAATLLDEAEKKLKAIAQEAGVDEKHPLVAGLLRHIQQRKETLGKRQDREEATPTFEKDVAPILVARCMNCHSGTRPRGRLSLETVAAMMQASGGRLVVPFNPNASILVQRVTASGEARMPKDGEPLTPPELRKIQGWVNAGAKFAGDKAAPLFELANAARAGDDVPLEINRATGAERVSFTKDIAPFMTNLCLNCHSGNNPRSGFSLETFEKLMKGGKSGRVVVPGDLQGSRLWDLAGEQDPIKMPPGDSLITRKNHRDLRVWIEEGAKFDGSDAKAPLRTLTVSTDLAKAGGTKPATPPVEPSKSRAVLAGELWEKALGSETPARHESTEFVFVGNVSQGRLKEIADWADEDARMLRKLFEIKAATIWPGKLMVFVFKDRFSYSEFAQTNEGVELPPAMQWHARIRPGQEPSYVCQFDAGDLSDDSSPGMRALLTAVLTDAALERLPNRPPAWALRGAGLALAARRDTKSPYFRQLSVLAAEAMSRRPKPAGIFEGEDLSSTELDPVGYTLSAHMLKLGGEAPFVSFLKALGSGRSLNDTLQTVYRADAGSLAQSYVAGLGGSAGPSRKAP